MFRARLKPSEQVTLERRYEFHLGEAVRAALLGDHEKAAGHSATALSISRELYAGARDPARYRPGLAAALAGHARYQRALDAVVLLAESAGHYAALAHADPDRYELARIDVLARVAIAADAAGSTRDAIRLLREVIGMYRQAPHAGQLAAGQVARDAGLARACFHLGRCLLTAGEAAEGLQYTDAGLGAADAALCGDGVTGESPDWLSGSPAVVQALAPDWLAAATWAMALHAAAGRWQAAAGAARAAVRVSGGLAALGSEDRRQAHEALLAQAQAVWARFRGAEAMTADRHRHARAITPLGAG